MTIEAIEIHGRSNMFGIDMFAKSVASKKFYSDIFNMIDLSISSRHFNLYIKLGNPSIFGSRNMMNKN